MQEENRKVDVEQAVTNTVKELELLVQFYRRRGWNEQANKIADSIAQMRGEKSDQAESQINPASPDKNIGACP